MKKEKVSKIVMVLLYLLCGAGIGVLCGNLFGEENFGIFLLGTFGVVLAALGMMLVHILLHEAGHLLFGLLTGYRFVSFRIFNLMWQKDDDGRIRLYHFQLSGTAGQCIMAPPDRKDGKMPFFWYHLGGVTVNFLLAILSGVLYIVVRDNAYVAFVCLLFGILGVLTGLTNALPLPGLANDGRNTVEMARSPKARKAFYLQMQAVIMLQKGIRIKDFPDEWFAMPTDEELQNTICCIMAVFLCDKLFDERKYAEAQAQMDDFLGRKTAIDTVHRQLLKVNALFCELAGKKNQVKIESYLDQELQKFMKAMPNYPGIIRTQYAYALYQNDRQAAQKQRDLFEKAALTYPYQVEIEAERECMALAAQLAE